ncbi:hypothetical protein BC629DRAFT_1650591 [Irpex lacteus]|nr:hypothetical protein BC629DRAFT_1650591 [Irpex lacteus]
MQNQNSIASFRNVEEVDQAIEEEEKKIQAIRERQRILRMHRNALTPACKLPPEVLSMIFALCAPYRGNLSLAFSQVCHHWRILSLGDPTIWRSPTFLYPRLAAHMIERAKFSPLRIQEDCAGHDKWFRHSEMPCYTT